MIPCLVFSNTFCKVPLLSQRHFNVPLCMSWNWQILWVKYRTAMMPLSSARKDDSSFGWPSTGPAPVACIVSNVLLPKIQPWLALEKVASCAPSLQATRALWRISWEISWHCASEGGVPVKNYLDTLRKTTTH